MDWNNDGKKDIITGESYDGGNVRVYLNQGTDAAPVFSEFSNVKVNNTDFAVGYYDGTLYFGSQTQPVVTDWNNDRKKDLLIGSILGQVYLLVNTGTDAAPVFSASPSLKTSAGSELLPGWRSSPVVIDWDGDGKKDLLAGNDAGNVQFYPNIGIDATPAFGTTQGTRLSAGGATLDVGGFARLALADWDNDGITDLLVGNSDGEVWFFRRRAVDSDADGLPDVWEIKHFQNTTANPNDDADGDGLTNIEEYLAGTDPRDSASVLRFEKISLSQDGAVVLTWRCVTGKHYILLQCLGLNVDAWTPVTSTPLVGGDSGTFSYTISTGIGRLAIFRVRLSQ